MQDVSAMTLLPPIDPFSCVRLIHLIVYFFFLLRFVFSVSLLCVFTLTIFYSQCVMYHQLVFLFNFSICTLTKNRFLFPLFPFLLRTLSTIVHHDTKKSPTFFSLLVTSHPLSRQSILHPQRYLHSLSATSTSLTFHRIPFAPYHPHLPSLTPLLSFLRPSSASPLHSTYFWQIIFEQLSLVYVLYESEINVSFP